VSTKRTFGVRAKKNLGQHFLLNRGAAALTAQAVADAGCTRVLEIGPGTGVLTHFLLQHPLQLLLCELDRESVAYLQSRPEFATCRLLAQDVLQLDFSKLFDGNPFCVAGNFPYNISSQILFKVLENRTCVPALVGMFQKEVAERVCASPGGKTYGILSVLVQAFYQTEYLLTLEPGDFSPPPQVHSAVIRIVRKETVPQEALHPLFAQVVKAAFNQRRKTLRNALAYFHLPATHTFAQRRAETLSVQEYLQLVKDIESLRSDSSTEK